MVETWLMRGEGGSVIPMDPPFPEAIQQRVAAGLIIRVSEDGTPWTDDAEPAPIEPNEPAVDPSRPAQAAPKADWVAYAVAVSDLTADGAEALTKAQLIERFG